MGFSFGGILFRHGSSIKDDTIKDALSLSEAGDTPTISMEKAVSGSFTEVGIARTDDLVIVIGRSIPFSLSFEGEDTLTSADKALMALSEKGDIIAILSDSISDTYAWSIFKDGKRIRVQKIVGNKLIFESGKPTEYDHNINGGSNRLMKLIENFTGHNYSELVFDLGLKVQVY